MRFEEFEIGGVLMSPFVPMMLAALVILVALRRLAVGLLGPRGVWHPALFEVSVYVILLCLVVLAVGGWRPHA